MGMADYIRNEEEFQHILRVMNTNLDGRKMTMYALCEIKGVGRRFSNIVCKKADVSPRKRAGELSADEVNRLVAVIKNPLAFKVPLWFLNRQKDWATGANMHITANDMSGVLRNDLERLKKIRCNRGLRHYWNIRVRG